MVYWTHTSSRGGELNGIIEKNELLSVGKDIQRAALCPKVDGQKMNLQGEPG